jgi:predicted DNA-binding transcriptional regulator AlpA
MPIATRATPVDVDSLPELLNVHHLEAFLGLSLGSAYRLMSMEGFPALRLGGRLRVRKGSLLRWLDETEVLCAQSRGQ